RRARTRAPGTRWATRGAPAAATATARASSPRRILAAADGPYVSTRTAAASDTRTTLRLLDKDVDGADGADGLVAAGVTPTDDGENPEPPRSSADGTATLSAPLSKDGIGTV